MMDESQSPVCYTGSLWYARGRPAVLSARCPNIPYICPESPALAVWSLEIGRSAPPASRQVSAPELGRTSTFIFYKSIGGEHKKSHVGIAYDTALKGAR